LQSVIRLVLFEHALDLLYIRRVEKYPCGAANFNREKRGVSGSAESDHLWEHYRHIARTRNEISLPVPIRAWEAVGCSFTYGLAITWEAACSVRELSQAVQGCGLLYAGLLMNPVDEVSLVPSPGVWKEVFSPPFAVGLIYAKSDRASYRIA